MLFGLFTVAHIPVGAAFLFNYLQDTGRWPILLCGITLILLNAAVLIYKLKKNRCYEK